jgi:hypothetical protein
MERARVYADTACNEWSLMVRAAAHFHYYPLLQGMLHAQQPKHVQT